MIAYLSRQPASLFYIFGGLVAVLAVYVIIRLLRERRASDTAFGFSAAYAGVLSMVAIASLAFPSVSQYLAANRQGSYAKVSSAGLTEAEKQRLFSEARSYNDRLTPTSYTEMGDPATGNGAQDEGYDDYLGVLDTGAGMGSIDIPTIGVNLPIHHGTQDDALDNGVGHIYKTAFPVGGQGTHSALTAHAGMAGKRLFTDLDNLDIGDTWSVTVLDEVVTYRVTQKNVVLPHELDPVAPSADKDLMSLITCTPTGINSHRLIVTGERVAD